MSRPDLIVAELNRLWEEMHKPSARSISVRSGVSQSTVSNALSGRRVPAQKTLNKIVEAVGGDPTTFDQWHDQPPQPDDPVDTSRGLLVDILRELTTIRSVLQAQRMDQMLGPWAK